MLFLGTEFYQPKFAQNPAWLEALHPLRFR